MEFTHARRLPYRHRSHHHSHAADTAEQHLVDSMEPVSHASRRCRSSYYCKEAEQHVSVRSASRYRFDTDLHEPGTPSLWPYYNAHSAVRFGGWSMEPGLPGAAHCSLPALGTATLEVMEAEARAGQRFVSQRARDGYPAVRAAT